MALWNNQRKKYLVEGENIFISQKMGDRDGLFIAKLRWPEGKIPFKGDVGVCFYESCNLWGDMVAWFRGDSSLLTFIHTGYSIWSTN